MRVSRATGLFLACSGLGIEFLSEPKKLTVEGYIHILREAVDQAIDLRERGAALENQMAPQLRQRKEHIQRF